MVRGGTSRVPGWEGLPEGERVERAERLRGGWTHVSRWARVRNGPWVLRDRAESRPRPPAWHDRVIEIGVVHLDDGGRITGEWSTLVNPERDLGPQHIHGINTADIRHAPSFRDISGVLADMLQGRTLVAHNLRFDWAFLEHEYARLGTPAPNIDGIGICTMVEAARFLPGAPRNLAGCCAAAGVRLDDHHHALADARAAAGLLSYYLTSTHSHVPWRASLDLAAELAWPMIEKTDVAWVRRGVAAERDTHFLARLVDRLPRTPEPLHADGYLALLDQVLLDHHISAAEADALVDLTRQLGLSRGDVDRLHRDYLACLVSAALADGIVTPAERHELELVTALLRIPSATIDVLMAENPASAVPRFPFSLVPGDLIVFTGDMDGGRESWEERARRAGFVPHGGVTKKVRLVVAADPDSLSGKARKARDYGIPIVMPEAFARTLG